MKSGDIIAFKGNGIIFRVLSFLLGRFDKDWREREWKPWHLAFVVEYHRREKRWAIAEAVATGVKISWLDEIDNEYKVHSYFDKPILAIRMREFVADRLGEHYDIVAYIWTILQYFWPSFPRIINNRWTCWELAAYFCRVFGKPWQPLLRYPLITDFLRAMENNPPKGSTGPQFMRRKK